MENIHTQSSALPELENHDYASLKAVASAKGYLVCSTLLCVMLVSLIFMLIFVPWQQSVAGTGKIIIFCPMERPQNIEALIPARLKKWHVQDGQTVKKGELIVELSEIGHKY